MSLEQLSAQLNQQLGSSSGSKKLPPVELWNPDFCGDIDLQIKNDGTWFYNGTPFKRLSLVQLFASVLKKEEDKYYLVTPVEKVGIEVEDVPFVLTQWQQQDDKSILVSTNLGDEFLLDQEHPITLSEQGHLYVTVRRNLLAKVHRNVYYQWLDIAQEEPTDKGSELVLYSAEHRFFLGKYE